MSSKFAICGLPIRLDTYKNCTFGCCYCFSNYRVIMERQQDIAIADVNSIKRRLDRIFNQQKINDGNFLDALVAKRFTWHCGGMSDPFQPINASLKITNQIIDVCNEYGIRILFSTKGDSIQDANCHPDLHSFQLSVTNVDDRKDIEPNVPPIAQRKRFFDELKKAGFKVGIRIQPFIPKVTDERIIDMFAEADHFTIEGLKLVPQNHEQIEYVCALLGIPLSAFHNDGLYNLDYSVREELYRPIIERIKTKTHATYNVSDNDMRQEGQCRCCCGDSLVGEGGTTGIDTTAMIKDCGKGYGLPEVLQRVKALGLSQCKCAHLFASNRQDFGKTVEDFFNSKFKSKSAPASPKFQNTNAQMEMFEMREIMDWMDN